MNTRTLGGQLTASAVGLGCMGMSEFYGPTDDETSVATIRHALDAGVTLIDSSDMYGRGHNEELIGRAVAGRRDEVQLATKFGFRRDGDNMWVDNSPEWIADACDASLRRLGVDHIDLYYMHRRDPDVPIEETVGAIAQLVQAGKVRHIGLCEVNPATLRAAYATHPITALQSEWSLFTRGIEAEIVPAARELGVGLVAYAPLGRGELTGRLELSESDARNIFPRFQGDNRERNRALVARVHEVADELGCTSAQVALAWLLEQGPDVVPIPGTRHAAYVDENAAATGVALGPERVQVLEEALPAGATAGERYPDFMMGDLEL